MAQCVNGSAADEVFWLQLLLLLLLLLLIHIAVELESALQQSATTTAGTTAAAATSTLPKMESKSIGIVLSLSVHDVLMLLLPPPFVVAHLSLSLFLLYAPI